LTKTEKASVVNLAQEEATAQREEGGSKITGVVSPEGERTLEKEGSKGKGEGIPQRRIKDQQPPPP